LTTKELKRGEDMDNEEFCSFKKDGCLVPSHSDWTCFKSDEKFCGIAVLIKERQKEKAKSDNE
jgi:hypothetical protein